MQTISVAAVHVVSLPDPKPLPRGSTTGRIGVSPGGPDRDVRDWAAGQRQTNPAGAGCVVWLHCFGDWPYIRLNSRLNWEALA